MLDFVNNTLLPKLKSLTGGVDKIAGLIRTFGHRVLRAASNQRPHNYALSTAAGNPIQGGSGE
ncbi:MAG TPA: hypothetical protein VJS42_12960 [Steroidobacteraceae bacterium]|nr:hypothetical protein [Steroidobacteraceae bacterium]